jgi:hypothetical protein
MLFRRTATPDPRVRRLQAELADAQQQGVELAARLVSTTRRADRAEEALAQRDGHAAMVARIAQQQREIDQLRKDRDGALKQLDDALYDAKTLEVINAGGISKVAAA